MVGRTSSDGYAAWLEKQAQKQADGTYLIRPWGRFSGVYQINAATLARWNRLRRSNLWLAFGMVVTVVGLKGDDPWNSLRTILVTVLTVGVFSAILYGWAFAILRQGERVAEDRWKGPAVVDPLGVVSRRRRLWSIIAGAVLLAWFVWASTFTPDGRSVQSTLVLLFLLALWLLSLVSYWRTRNSSGSSGIEQQDSGPWSRPQHHDVPQDGEPVTRSYRTLLAILLAPSALALVATILRVLAILFGDSALKLPDGYDGLFLLGLLGVSYAVSYTIGVPIYLLIRRRGWRSRGAYLGGSFIMGFAVLQAAVGIGLIISAFFGADRFWAALGALQNGHLHGLHWLVAPTLVGVVTMPIGLLFWLIARPDRSD
jgi:hypothetical protein